MCSPPTSSSYGRSKHNQKCWRYNFNIRKLSNSMLWYCISLFTKLYFCRGGSLKALTQISYKLWGCSFLRVGLNRHKSISIIEFYHSFRRLMWKSYGLPVIVFDEFHQLLLSVRLSRDDHRLVDEGFIKVDFVELQLQSLSNLSDRTETFDPSSTVIDLQQAGIIILGPLQVKSVICSIWIEKPSANHSNWCFFCLDS